MNMRRAVTVLGTVALGVCFAWGPSSSEGSVTIQSTGSEEAVHLAIESALAGIGTMISASSAGGTVDVRRDVDGAAYHIRGADGSTVTIDARTGKYTIHARNPEGVSATVERSLDGVGTVLRAVHRSRTGSARAVEVALSEAEHDALVAAWRARGLTGDQIDAYSETLANADAIERYARQLERDAGALERSIEVDAGRIEREAERIEREANRIERDVERIEHEAGDVSAGSEALFSCRDDDLILRGRAIETPGVAIIAYANCSVLIVDCEISSGSVAIRASGNVDVEIRDSRIEGLTAAIELAGNATAEASGTDFVGRVITTGNAELEDLGGNTFSR
jgi:hypothetical protein